MAPPSDFVPRHRRPSRINHRANLEAEFRKRTPAMVQDADTFYYNEAFTSEWAMPPDLWVRLPTQFTSEIKIWQAAGAAVMTVLTRYDKLELEATSRGWPEHKNAHLSRTTSCASPSVYSVTSPALSSTTSPVLGSPLTEEVATLYRLDTMFDQDTKFDRNKSAMIDTPPFTPQDSNLSEQLSFESEVGPTTNKEAYLDQVNSRLASMTFRSPEQYARELSPSPTPSSRRSSARSQTSAPVFFDEGAWDVYLNACKAELDHLRTETLVRFRHLGHGINKLWTDLKNDNPEHLLGNASAEFSIWWKRMSEKAQECENEAKALELPNLEEVKLERLAQGLSV